MKVRMKDCQNCGKQYGATNGNQLYCCDSCRQQAYYKRHNIDRSHSWYGRNVNPMFTEFAPINGISPNNDVNNIEKEKEQISPAPVTQVKPLIESSSKAINNDNFGAILEQMNKTHQAQMEAMETRLKLSFAQERHAIEKQAKEDIILKLQEEIKEKDKKSSIDTGTVLAGLSNILAGTDIKELLKAQA